MTVYDKQLAKKMLKAAVIVVAAIVGCRLTHGALTLLIAALGVRAALSRKAGLAIACFVFYPFLTIINPAIKGGAANGMIIRVGLMAIALAMISGSANRKGRYVLPIVGIFGYMAVSVISSIFGYAPVISFLKLFNFLGLILGLWFGFKNLQCVPREAEKARWAFLAMVGFLIGGSLLTILVPAYGYANDMDRLAGVLTSDEFNDYIRNSSTAKYFSGVTNQSQCLAVVLPCAIAWLLCDMLFVERRVSKIHTALIFAGLPLIYMTHSRTAFVTTMAAVMMVYGYCITKIPVKPKIKKTIQRGMVTALVLAVIGALVVEVKDRSVSKFLRKTEDVEADTRSLGTAFTGSRQGLMAESLYDFQQSPLFGKGFQVAWYHRGMKGLQFSAPVEKGVLPVMILGETGVLGEIAFIIFLVMFYSACVKQRFVVTMTLFTTFLATNLGEASFFSPGGAGGILWVLCVGGGFVLDTLVVVRKQQEANSQNIYPIKVMRVFRRIPCRFESRGANNARVLTGPGPNASNRQN